MAKWLVTVPVGTSLSPDLLRSAARNVPDNIVPQLVDRAKRIAGGDTSLQASLLFAARRWAGSTGSCKRPAYPRVGGCTQQLSQKRFSQDGAVPENSPVPGCAIPTIRGRCSSATPPTAKKGQPFFSSLPPGEEGVRILRSQSFTVPKSLSFWCAGHSGFPSNGNNGKNKSSPDRSRNRAAIGRVVSAHQRLSAKDRVEAWGSGRQKAYIEIRG